MLINVDRQRELFDRHAPAAAIELQKWLCFEAPALIARAAERVFTVGLDDYGDKTYHLRDVELVDEMFDELADGIFYAHIGVARRAGDL
jgi:hypothetical protein